MSQMQIGNLSLGEFADALIEAGLPVEDLERTIAGAGASLRISASCHRSDFIVNEEGDGELLRFQEPVTPVRENVPHEMWDAALHHLAGDTRYHCEFNFDDNWLYVVTPAGPLRPEKYWRARSLMFDAQDAAALVRLIVPSARSESVQEGRRRRPGRPPGSGSYDDAALVTEALQMLDDRCAKSAHDAAVKLEPRAKGTSREAKIKRLAVKIRAAMPD